MVRDKSRPKKNRLTETDQAELKSISRRTCGHALPRGQISHYT